MLTSLGFLGRRRRSRGALLASLWFVSACNASASEATDDVEQAEPETAHDAGARLDAGVRLDARVPARDDGGVDALPTTPSDAARPRDAATQRADAALEAPALESCQLEPLAAGDHEYTLVSKNGLTYKYTLVVPTTVQPRQRAPLALVWHALRSSPEETRGLTDVDLRAADIKAYSVHPRSPDQSWNTGSCCTATVLGLPRDELVFTRELLADIKSKVCIDDKKIYTTGFSNGGMMSQMLACNMADVFAAAAPMGSTLTVDPNTCKPTRAVPMLMINGTADPLVGYDAPSLSGGLSVPDAFEHWANRNGCTGEPVVSLQKGKVTCKTYDACSASSDTTLCTVEGMGHCMPGMKEESPSNCFTKLIPLGPPNHDVDGMTLAFEFLARYSLP